MVVEQPREARCRTRFDAASGEFVSTDVRSILFDRGFPGVYGWVEGLGQPPGSHCDILLVTDLSPKAGSVAVAYVAGIFFRSDLDHKILALDEAYFHLLRSCDFAELPSDLRESIERLYPRPGKTERWAGAEEAKAHLQAIRHHLIVPNAD